MISEAEATAVAYIMAFLGGIAGFFFGMAWATHKNTKELREIRRG